jgi:anhydro-N-acetylmuramic acid kinase
MDGIDAVVVSIPAKPPLTLKATHNEPYPPDIRRRLRAAMNHSANDPDAVAQLDMALGELFAKAASRACDQAGLDYQQVSAIGSHGQTIRHGPNAPQPYSIQIGNPSLTAKRTGIATAADFRSADIAAGGQGAPLAPAFHQWMFHSLDRNRVIVNIGGIANVSYLPADRNRDVVGFDTGPGNTLLDGWITKHQQKTYDADGRWAATGKCARDLLVHLLTDPYFKLKPPKSTGFEYFNLAWLERHIAKTTSTPSAADVQATLVELTACSIAQALDMFLPKVDEVYICGGGSHNLALMAQLRKQIPKLPIETTTALGLDPDWVEATAFAWLAQQTLAGKPGNLPSVTGAQRAVVLGQIFKP